MCTVQLGINFSRKLKQDVPTECCQQRAKYRSKDVFSVLYQGGQAANEKPFQQPCTGGDERKAKLYIHFGNKIKILSAPVMIIEAFQAPTFTKSHRFMFVPQFTGPLQCP